MVVTPRPTRGKRTVGMVISYRDYYNRRSSTLVAPIIRYSAPGGVYDFTGCLSVPRRLYPIDKEVTVIYLPGNPKNAVVVDFTQMFMIPSIVCGLGLLVLAGTAGIMLIVTRSELANSPAQAFPSFQPQSPPATSAPPKETVDSPTETPVPPTDTSDPQPAELAAS